MIKKVLQDDSGNVGTLLSVFAAVVLLVSIAIVFSLGGFVLSLVDSIIPPVIENSPWNASENPAMVTGNEIWHSASDLLSAVTVLSVITIVLASFFKKKDDREEYRRPQSFEK